jgi:hypothetical protein
LEDETITKVFWGARGKAGLAGERLTGKYVLCFDDGRFFNHSDSPNVIDGLTPDTAQSSIAVRDIFPGEELTCDYRTFDALSRYGMEDPMLAARTNGPGRPAVRRGTTPAERGGQDVG